MPRDEAGAHRIGAGQVYILPTRTGLVYGLVAGLMLIGSLNYQNNLALLFTFLMVSLGVVAMHHCWLDLVGLVIQVRPRGEVFAGNPARFEVILINRRHRSRYDLGLTSVSGRGAAGLIGAHEQLTLSIGVETQRRGELSLKELVVDTNHPMHLFRAWCVLSPRAKVVVYPRPADWALAPMALAGDEDDVEGVRGDGAGDFEGPREYRLGDSPRRIDWKALARQRGLVTKQFSGGQASETWLDWRSLSSPDPEKRLSILARQAIELAAGNRPFGLRLPGLELPPSSGEDHVARCLRELALFDVEDQEEDRA